MKRYYVRLPFQTRAIFSSIDYQDAMRKAKCASIEHGQARVVEGVDEKEIAIYRNGIRCRRGE